MKPLAELLQEIGKNAETIQSGAVTKIGAVKDLTFDVQKLLAVISKLIEQRDSWFRVCDYAADADLLEYDQELAKILSEGK